MSVGKLTAGLYLVATPIGAARDITLRGLDVLSNADVLAAEDTRNTRRLLDIHGVKLEGRPLLAYHDHNGPAQRPKLIAAIKEGKSIAYVSDAGTPLIADPGYALAREVIDAGLLLVAAPGASAVLAALCVAGLPTDRFFFAGFPPNKAAARRSFFAELAQIDTTLVFYESPKRIHASLGEMAHTLGQDRKAAVCRELTKKFEEIQRNSLGELVAHYADRPNPKGEIVVVVGPPQSPAVSAEDLDSALKQALESASVKDAAQAVSGMLGLPRKKVYARALEILKNT